MTVTNLKTTVLSVRRAKLYRMFNDLAATGDSGWLEDEGVDEGSLELFLSTAGTLNSCSVQLYGSNSNVAPADDGFAIGAAITALGIVPITTKCRFYKVKLNAVSLSGGGKLGARLHCHTFKS